MTAVVVLGSGSALAAMNHACSHDAGKFGNPIWPVQQVKVEMISTETGEARVARPLNAVSRDMGGPDLGDQEYAIALTGNHTTDQSLGVAISIYLCSVD